MSVSFSATPGGYYAVTQPFGVPAQRQRPAAPEPSDAQNGTSFTMPPGVPLHGNPKDLVADLCKIIERQSQEIAALRAERAERAPFSPPREIHLVTYPPGLTSVYQPPPILT